MAEAAAPSDSVLFLGVVYKYTYLLTYLLAVAVPAGLDVHNMENVHVSRTSKVFNISAAAVLELPGCCGHDSRGRSVDSWPNTPALALWLCPINVLIMCTDMTPKIRLVQLHKIVTNLCGTFHLGQLGVRLFNTITTPCQP